PRRILVFYRCETFVHGSIVAGNFAMQELGRKTGAFTADLADEYSVFNKANLEKYDAILFNNTTSLALENDDQRNAILGFVGQGKGVAGIHAASDNFYRWKTGARMIGGQFNGHPWGGGGTWSFKLDDPKHILNQAFKGRGFWHKDEIYQYKPETYVGGDKLRVLVSLDLNTEQTMKPLNRNEGLKKQYTEGGRTVPVSWIRTFEGGRVFYTNLGHNASTYWNPAVLQHYLDGLQYALGDLTADATPSSKITREEVLAPPAP
ncbi:MAG: ThuA domain-containing protein, partial [Verrucomicrobiales bacterium]|nr:ThuA domain-containing protein [Verrucomicrobiales bacterium]